MTIKSLYDQGNDIDVRKIADALSFEDAAVFQDIVDSVTFPSDSDRILADCIEKIKLEDLSKRQQEILTMLSLLSENDNEKIDALSRELMSIQAKLQKIRK
jgi:ATP-dependent Lon protease